MEHVSRKIILSIGLGTFLACVELYLHFLAPLRIRMQVEAVHLDKVLHIAGGIFLASVLEWRVRRLSFWDVLGIVLVLSLAWKAFEFYVDPTTHHYILTHLTAWTLDLIGDCAATILGSLLYWNMTAKSR